MKYVPKDKNHQIHSPYEWNYMYFDLVHMKYEISFTKM